MDSAGNVVRNDEPGEEGLIRYKLPDIRKLGCQLSPRTMFRNTEWWIRVERNKRKVKRKKLDNLAIYLYYMPEARNPMWSPEVHATFSIIPHDLAVERYTEGFQKPVTFTSSDCYWGIDVIEMKDLLNLTKGYTAPDDYTLQVEVNFTVKDPQQEPHFRASLGKKRRGSERDIRDSAAQTEQGTPGGSLPPKRRSLAPEQSVVASVVSNNGLLKQISERFGKIEQLESEVDKLKQELNEKNAAVQKLEFENSDLKNQVAAFVNQVQDKDMRIQELEAVVAAKETETEKVKMEERVRLEKGILDYFRNASCSLGSHIGK